MSNAQINTLAKVIGNAEAGGYSLPPELLESWATFERVRGLTIDDPPSLPIEDAAGRVVAAAAAGDTPDVAALGRDLHRFEGERQAHAHAGRIFGEAREQAANAAVMLAADLTERIIADHLRPTLEAVYAGARVCAAALAGFGLDPRKLLDAPAKTRTAAGELGSLVVRRDLIFGARSWINFVGSRKPMHDPENMFVEFERPELLTPWWSPGPARWPGLQDVAPQDPSERLLWVASDAVAAANPWLPTTAEADERWWAMFGEKSERFAQSRRDAESAGARGSF